MKRKDLLLLTFLLSQTAPLWAMDETSNFTEDSRAKKSFSLKERDSVDKVQQLKDKLLHVEKRIEIFPTELLVREKVFLLGTTGAGKSTLLNLLVKNNLEVDEKGRFDTKDPVKGSEIGHEITSTTTFPSLCLGPNDVVFVDFPGFGDSGGEEKDLIHAYVRKKLFSGNFKILLAVEEKELDGKPLQFLKVLQDLTKTIPVERLKESLALVVTKQGRLWNHNSYDALKKLPHTNSGKIASSLTEDVKILLRHLTEEDKINTRVPYFPYQKTAGIYESSEVRENILFSINSLIPMTNPQVHFQLPAESTLLILKLARDLNRDIENALKTIVKPKVVQLCETYTTAYNREGSMEELGYSLKAIKSALDLLANVSEENMGNFPSLFNGFFDQGGNIVKEYVKTLMFLKSLKTDIEYLTPSWAHGLQLTLEEIHGLIDSLGNRLFQKITTFVESVRYLATQCCDTAPESDNEKEVYIEGLTQKLRNIKTAMTVLREAIPETMINFVQPLEMSFPGNGTNTAEKSLGTLKFLSTLKEIAYPKESWLDILNLSTIHIQKEIDTQQRLIDLNRRLEEERLRQEEAAKVCAEEEEATSREREETERRHQAEVTRKEEELRQQQEEIRRIDTEAAERQRQLELREKERLLEVERQRITDLDEQRRLREEERRDAERRASEQQQLQLEANRQLLAMLEAQRLTQLEEKQRLETLLNETKTETGTKLKTLEDQVKETKSKRLVDLQKADEQLKAQAKEAEAIKTREKLALEKATAEKLAAEKLAAQKLEKVNTEMTIKLKTLEEQVKETEHKRLTDLKKADEQFKAQAQELEGVKAKEKLILEKAAAEKLAAEKLATQKLEKTSTEMAIKLKTLEDNLKKGEETSKNLTIKVNKQDEELKYFKAHENKLQQALSQQLAEAKQKEQKVTLLLNTVTQEKQKLANEKLALDKQRVLNLPNGRVSKADYDFLPENRRKVGTIVTRKVEGKKVQLINTTAYYKIASPRVNRTLKAKK